MESTIVVADHPDTRPSIAKLGGEREQLDAWLTMYRETVLLKIAGLTGEQLAARPVPPSTLSLLGVVRHLTEVERYWLRDVLHAEKTPDVHSSDGDPDADLNEGTAESAAQDVAQYQAEILATRAAQAAWTDLDVPVAGQRKGEPLNLRWILIHLIEEYARHLGHMDLLREAVDGRTGY